MTLNEATEIMQKTRQCGSDAMDCLEKGIPCSGCKFYVEPEKLEQAEDFTFRLLLLWPKAKEDIRKACGCLTALDILEKYEKTAEGVET